MIDVEISRLIRMIESGSGPDRKLDRAIFETCFPDHTGEAPFFTESMVAALTLFPSITPRELCVAALMMREKLE